MEFDRSSLDKLPLAPGVYLMKSSSGTVLYVGKAKELRVRVKQYFVPGRDSRSMVPLLVENIAKIDTIVVTSEREALLLEDTLIKQHRPKYNALLKDDKSYLAFKLEQKTPWPRLQLVRYRGEPSSDALYFGPYTSALTARQTWESLQRIFLLRQCSDAEFARRTRPCLLYGLKRCKAPCVGKCTEEEYQKDVARVIAFLRGREKQVVRELHDEMIRRAEALQFEQAAILLKSIRWIEAQQETQRVALLPGSDLDALALYREQEDVVVAQLFVRGGKVTGLRTFPFENNLQTDEELWASFLLQQYTRGEKGKAPPEIILSTRLEDGKLLEELVQAKIYCPQRGLKRSLIELAATNAKSAFHQQKDVAAALQRTLLSLQEHLRLVHYPRRIECFDNSHLSGSECVSAMAVFIDGALEPKSCRTYKVHVAPGDDYGALRETLQRRCLRAKEEGTLPDLIAIDGGKGHLQVAMKVLADLDIAVVDIIAIAKEEARHDKGSTQEQIFLPNIKDPLLLRRNSPVLFLLQQVRDEAHRLALRYQQKRRSKTLVKSSLDDIAGIGPAKRKALLIHFGGLQAIKEASIAELKAVTGISEALAVVIHQSLKPKT